MIKLSPDQQKTYDLIKQNDKMSAERYIKVLADHVKNASTNYSPEPNHICTLQTCKKPFHSYAIDRKYCSNKCANIARTLFKGRALGLEKKFGS